MNSKVVLLIILLIIIIISSIGAYFLLNKKKSSGTPLTSINIPSTSDNIPPTSDIPLMSDIPLTSDTPLTSGSPLTSGTPSTNTVNCSNLSNLNYFCIEPDKYVEKCVNDSNKDQAIASLYLCLKDYTTQLKKESYERAVELLEFPSNLPSKFPTADCRLQDTFFCKKPDEYVDSCFDLTNVSPKDGYYANKMRECVTTEYPSSASQEIKNNLKVSYNKAKDTLEEKYPDIKILKFPSIACEFEPQAFCYDPDLYIEDCIYTKIPRNYTQNQLKDEARKYGDKINKCLLSAPSPLINKNKFKKAKDMLLEINGNLTISDPPTKPCTEENSPNMFCQFPDEYIQGCKALNSNTDSYYIEKLRTCIRNNMGLMKDETYKNALTLLPNNDLPESLPKVDCKLENQSSYFCGSIKDYITGCKTSNTTPDSSYIDKLRNCLIEHREKIKKEDYDEAIKLLDQNLVKNSKLPLELPTVDCYNVSESNNICRTPDEFVKQCKDTPDYEYYSSMLLSCLTNNKGLMKKEKYEEAVKLLNYPKSLPAILPSIDCSTQDTQKQLFCRDPETYIKECRFNNNTTNEEYIAKLKNCVNNNYLDLKDNPNSYSNAIKILGNPEDLPKTIPTVNCKNKNDLTSFCLKPNEYVKGCPGIFQPENLLLTCVKDYYIRLKSEDYKEAVELLNNPVNLPKTLPSVDCKNNIPDICVVPDRHIDECSILNRTKDQYKSILKDCFKNKFQSMDNTSYKNALKKLDNPKDLPRDLTVNCSLENTFEYCKDPYKYISTCEGVNQFMNYEEQLVKCVNDDAAIKTIDPSSYKKAVEYLKSNRLPKELPTVLCKNKDVQSAFCSKPDEYIRDCQIEQPGPIDRLKACFSNAGTNYIKEFSDNPQKYINAYNLLGKPSELPASPPIVACGSDIANDPYGYIISCKYNETPDNLKKELDTLHSLYKSGGYSDRIKESYNKARDYILNKDPTLKIKLFPDINCNALRDPRFRNICNDPYNISSKCEDLTIEEIKSCITDKNKLQQLNFEEYLKLINSMNLSNIIIDETNLNKLKSCWDKSKNKLNIDYYFKNKDTCKVFETDAKNMCNFDNDPNTLLVCSREGLSEGVKNSCEIYQKETGRDLSIFGFTYKETTDAFRDENFVKNNPDVCRTLGIEPCNNKNYASNNPDSCAGKITKNPCLSPNGNYKYLRENGDECRKLKLGEPCSISDYLVSKPTECRNIQSETKYEPCSVDSYLATNPSECRDINKPDGTKYEPCIVDSYLSGNPTECRGIQKPDGTKYEPCSVETYLTYNPTECRGVNKPDGTKYEPCSVDSYLTGNPTQCRGINKPDGTKYEPCTVKSYLFNNSKECRNINVIYEACESQDFLFNKSAECRTVTNKDGYKYDPCYNDTYSKEQIDINSKGDRTECYKIQNCDSVKSSSPDSSYFYKEGENYDTTCVKRDFKRYHKCDDKFFLLSNSKECRKLDRKYEACKDSDYLKNNYTECREAGFDPCKIDDYLINNPVECRNKGFEPCENNMYRTGTFYTENGVQKNNIIECSRINDKYNPCKDDNFLIFNGNLCRDTGIEPCKNNQYISNNPTECRNKGIEPCEKTDYISLHKEECRRINDKYEPCEDKQYLILNPSECRSVNSKYEPCKEEDYIKKSYENALECDIKNPTKYNSCINSQFKLSSKKCSECNNKNYLLLNSSKCREENKDFEACEDPEFLRKNLNECRKISDKYEPCINMNYRWEHSEECRNINNKYEPCKEEGFLLKNSVKCRNINSSFEACENYFYRSANNEECKNIDEKYDICKDPNERNSSACFPCDSEEYLFRNPSECRNKKDKNGTSYEPCTKSAYLQLNSIDCRSKGFEACKNLSFLQNNPVECRNNGFEPCSSPGYFYKDINTIQECKNFVQATEEDCDDNNFRGINQDKCDLLNFNKYNKCLGDQTGFDINYTTKNKKKCRDTGIEPCDNIFYKSQNQDECDTINFEKYNNCIGGMYTDYMLKNGKKCRELGQTGKLTFYTQPFEPCIYDNNYAENNVDECKDYITQRGGEEREGEEYREEREGDEEGFSLPFITPKSFLKFRDYNTYMRTMSIML